MDTHRITLSWDRAGGPFERGNYRKDHRIRYDGGESIAASPAPSFGGDAQFVDPEQMLVSALSSCHMLTFLAVAANRGYVVDHYDDEADCVLGKADGKTIVTAATLRPKVSFSGDERPSDAELGTLHERAHQACFIANSVKTAVTVAPRA